MKLLHPYWLFLFLIYIPLIWWYIAKHKGASPYVGVSSLSGLKTAARRSWRVLLMHFAFVLRLLAIAVLIIALCRPQTHSTLQNSLVEGTDIVIALDISPSMAAEDLKPNRFESARSVARDFINGRENDNIGLVVFAAESFSIMPLTNDRQALSAALDGAYIGMLSNGTAIGDGLASAINRLEGGKAKSKSIILLTDGANNRGDVPPLTAARIAADKGIRVYTIGVGRDGVALVPDNYGYLTRVETKVDEESLNKIAETTGGKYFRAMTDNVLTEVFEEIDKLEKSKIEVERYNRTDEAYMTWAWIALGLFLLEVLMRYTLLRRIP